MKRFNFNLIKKTCGLDLQTILVAKYEQPLNMKRFKFDQIDLNEHKKISR